MTWMCVEWMIICRGMSNMNVYGVGEIMWGNG